MHGMHEVTGSIPVGSTRVSRSYGTIFATWTGLGLVVEQWEWGEYFTESVSDRFRGPHVDLRRSEVRVPRALHDL